MDQFNISYRLMHKDICQWRKTIRHIQKQHKYYKLYYACTLQTWWEKMCCIKTSKFCKNREICLVRLKDCFDHMAGLMKNPIICINACLTREKLQMQREFRIGIHLKQTLFCCIIHKNYPTQLCITQNCLIHPNYDRAKQFSHFS